MLSILIPVHNYLVNNLVVDLIKQIRDFALPSEIIIVDDASDNFLEENESLIKYDEVKYFCFEENKGRSYARNFLAKQANYQHLLFIDCDAKIVRNDFLITYYQYIKSNKDVVCGGVIYSDAQNVKKEYYLRWYYGIKREQKQLTNRKKFPYQSFSSFNFLIRKDIFYQIKFPEQINTYGHEDTFFGIALKNNRVKIEHIDNPLMHMGLETAEVFIEKTKKSVQNINKLVALIPDQKMLISEIKIYRYIYIVRKYNIRWLIKILFRLTKSLLIKNLTSYKPNLKLFDFYKLGYYFYLN